VADCFLEASKAAHDDRRLAPLEAGIRLQSA